MRDEYGMDELLLMENAARAVTTYIVDRFEQDSSVLFVVGGGNNGGDGWAAARQLLCEKYAVEVLCICSEKELKPAAEKNYQLAKQFGVAHCFDCTPEQVERLAAKSDIVVDAMFGTGFSGKPTEKVKRIIDVLNESGSFLISVDVPSCINALTGAVEETAVQSDAVIVLGSLKTGLLLYPAADYVGETVIAPISIPTQVYDHCENRSVYQAEDISNMLRPRYANSFKGDYGRLGIIAGSTGYTGAACLAAQAALRSGVGLISLAVPQSLNPVFEVKLTEQMTVPMPEDGEGHLIASKALAAFSEGKDALLIGPGMGMKADGAALIAGVLEHFCGRCVIDADGLNFIALHPDLLKNVQCELILTPHIGEAARLLACSTREVLEDSVESAKRIAAKYNAVVVLKNAVSIIADPEGNVVFNTTGSNGMATGGSGDVLAGIIASLAAQGCPAFSAAIAGAYVNGWAGEIAAEKLGEISMLPSDTVHALSEVFQQIAL